MKISLITPAKKHSKNGNRTSAMRWARFLRDMGHHVRVDLQYLGDRTDLMIALHAWRSAASIKLYRKVYPKGPLIVALGGTDVNTFLKSNPTVTEQSMDEADALIGLHERIKDELPIRFHKNLHIIKQSAQPAPSHRAPTKRHFDICVVGHLREEKDPFCAAFASRLLPHDSRLRVIHLGKAHSPKWAKQAKSEMRHNPRYIWRGEVPKWQVRREYVKTHLMVISSSQEGGANVVSEAIMAGVPIIASYISGNIGLLGKDYPGYYPVSDRNTLASMLHRAETKPNFLRLLEAHGRKIQRDFTPEMEALKLNQIVKLVTKKS